MEIKGLSELTKQLSSRLSAVEELSKGVVEAQRLQSIEVKMLRELAERLLAKVDRLESRNEDFDTSIQWILGEIGNNALSFGQRAEVHLIAEEVVSRHS